MPPNDDQPERVWDEYQWERFLQQQDRKTERYMELLEKYMDHPERDQIIAREMGWSHLLDGAEEDWIEEADAQLASELGLEEDGSDAERRARRGWAISRCTRSTRPRLASRSGSTSFSTRSAICRTTPPR